MSQLCNECYYVDICCENDDECEHFLPTGYEDSDESIDEIINRNRDIFREEWTQYFYYFNR